MLWALFSTSLALGLDSIKPFTGWALVLTSQVSATVPAFLGITGLGPAVGMSRRWQQLFWLFFSNWQACWPGADPRIAAGPAMAHFLLYPSFASQGGVHVSR